MDEQQYVLVTFVWKVPRYVYGPTDRDTAVSEGVRLHQEDAAHPTFIVLPLQVMPE